MKKEDFLKLGLSEELALAAEAASTKELTEMAAAKTELEKQLQERDKDIAGLKKAAGENTELTNQYAGLQEKYKADTEALAKRLSDSAKHSAVDLAILQAGGRNPKAIKALLDMEKIALAEDGTLTGLELAALQKSDGYLFETTRIEGSGITAGAQETKAAAQEFAAALGR